MLSRFVFWHESQWVPAWRTMEFTPGEPLSLRDIPWIVDACGGFNHTLLEVFVLDLGMWSVQSLARAKIDINPVVPVVLCRILGVEHCAFFGRELELMYDMVHIPPLPDRLPMADLRWDDHTSRYVNVLTWTKDGEPPYLHRISFSYDNAIHVARHAELYALFGNRRHIELWLADTGEWVGIPVMGRFWLDAKYDTVLLKLHEVGITRGLGRELVAFDRLRDLEGKDAVWFASQQITTDLLKSVPPAYDLADTVFHPAEGGVDIIVAPINVSAREIGGQLLSALDLHLKRAREEEDGEDDPDRKRARVQGSEVLMM